MLNYIYPGPQSGSIGNYSFSVAKRDFQALAELGFIVIGVDAMGTPGRSKSFHDAYYGNMGDNGLPDNIKAIKDLSKIIHEAFEVATTGRPGPVLVDIPKDIQFAKIGYSKPKIQKKLN